MKFWDFMRTLKSDIPHEEFASLTKIDIQLFNRLQETETIPSDDMLKQICDGLGYESSDLIFRAHKETGDDDIHSFTPPQPVFPFLRKQIIELCTEQDFIKEFFSPYDLSFTEELIYFAFYFFSTYIGDKFFQSDRMTKYVALNYPSIDHAKERKKVGFIAAGSPDTHFFEEWLSTMEKKFAQTLKFQKFPSFPDPSNFSQEEKFHTAVTTYNIFLKKHTVPFSIYLSYVKGMQSIKYWQFYPLRNSIKIIDKENNDYIYYLCPEHILQQHMNTKETKFVLQTTSQNGIPILSEVKSPDDLKVCFNNKNSGSRLEISQDIFGVKVDGNGFMPLAFSGQMIFFSSLDKPKNGDIVLVRLSDNSIMLRKLKKYGHLVVLESLVDFEEDRLLDTEKIVNCYKVRGIWFS